MNEEELFEIFKSKNKDKLAIGCEVYKNRKCIIITLGNFKKLKVPFSEFKPSGTGECPNFEDVEIIDYGQTLRLGVYESTIDCLLDFIEFD